MQVSDSRVFADAEKEVENQRLVKRTPAHRNQRAVSPTSVSWDLYPNPPGLI